MSTEHIVGVVLTHFLAFMGGVIATLQIHVVKNSQEIRRNSQTIRANSEMIRKSLDRKG